MFQEFLKGKTFLVTGGCGSIGSVLVKNLLSMNVKVKVLDNNESELALIQRKFKGLPLEVFLADVRDRESLVDAVSGADVVIHAAALKHVTLGEYNPIEYVKTNVLGTQNLIEVSQKEKVQKFMLISTDKAVEPINVMGATKLLAERLTIAANLAYRGKDTKFSCVRFGNVLYTRGSVLEIFLEQIKRGGPITVTDPNMTRFIMSIKKAAKLVLKALSLAECGEIFIFKMDSVRIMDLAQAFIEVFAPKFGFDSENVEIKIIGRRSGEKLHEKLMTEIEAENAVEIDDEMYVIYSELIKWSTRSSQITRKAKRVPALASNTARLLTKEEIKKLLIDFYEEYYNER